MTAPCFKIEKDYAAPVVGVDEAGRGPLAGPVVAAAVILDRKRCPRGIDDSKKLCFEVRESLYGKLRQVARIGVGIASVEEIDRYNILWATMLAMTRAVEALGIAPGMVLVDGNRCPNWSYPSTAIIGGDAKSRSIAAASIVAKVTRDRMMTDYCDQHPGYNWRSNKGYGTPDHRAALDRLGPTPLHRRTFAPVKQHLLDL
ncbi:ribonuclease HII [Allosphingosinicella flava]|uniref:Ribonuclease HII n=1 Tax=Allosphingosinicella flava TaxID=2771430 RepID=A0A7T2GJQ4_9SPHN|nr:ribonuclease HII [Sphingosinicella flava]QPQ55138.1 ribonuclease HII [Sphingosinicella flava]